MEWSKPIKARRPIGFIEPCIPTAAAKVPEGPMWLHEIKHDGYRLMVRRSGDRVRLFTRRGYDWSERYPRIIDAAKKIKGAFLIDGEAVVSDEHGIADFERLHSREHDKSATLWAFDLLELDGKDLRQLPLDERKSKLAKLLRASRHSGTRTSTLRRTTVQVHGPTPAYWASRASCQSVGTADTSPAGARPG